MSCSNSKFVITPYFTDNEKIQNLEVNSSIQETNQMLGVQPNNVLFYQDDIMLCEYIYRIKDRRVNTLNNETFKKKYSEDQRQNENEDQSLNSDLAQNSGIDYLKLDYYKLYIYFKNNRLEKYITADGLENSLSFDYANRVYELLNRDSLKYEFFEDKCNPCDCIDDNSITTSISDESDIASSNNSNLNVSLDDSKTKSDVKTTTNTNTEIDSDFNQETSAKIENSDNKFSKIDSFDNVNHELISSSVDTSKIKLIDSKSNSTIRESLNPENSETDNRNNHTTIDNSSPSQKNETSILKENLKPNGVLKSSDSNYKSGDIVKHTFSTAKNEEIDESKIPLNVQLSEQLIYRVQVGAFSMLFPKSKYKLFSPISAEEIDNNLYRYLVGYFNSFKSANQALSKIKSVGYPNAFIVAYHNKESISLSQAQKIEKTSIHNTTNIDDFEIVIPQNKNEVKTIPITSIDSLFFTVQVGVFSKPLTAKEFKKIEPLVKQVLPNGWLRYSSGIINTIEEAEKKRLELLKMGFKKVFVTAYNKGNKITLSEARKILRTSTQDK